LDLKAGAKIVVVGLELGDGQLLQAWARAGKLPFLAGLIERGCWGWLDTTADHLHISAWPTIYTGVAPGEHGVYFTFQPAPGLQGYQRFHAGLYGRPTVWQILDRAGRRCAVIDPPYSHPEEGFGGRFVYDWGSWAHYLQPGSVPAGLLKQLEQACGPYPLGSEANDLGFAPLERADTARRLVTSVRSKAEATCWLMRQSPADLVFTVFGETHVAGHYCWSSELADPQQVQAESPMLLVYQELDRAIERIHREAGDGATVIVISGDRVGPNHAGWHLLPDVLVRLGYLASGDAPRPVGEAPRSGRKFDPVKALRDLLPKDFRKSLARKLPTKLRDKLAQRVDTADIDWSRTRAYCLPTDLEGYIRINLSGREPQGIVAPGAEYETLLDEISAALTDLADPETNRPLVREVLRASRSFPGERLAYLPDLIVRWAGEGPVTGATSARIGTLQKESPDPRPGTHTGPGFVLASGPSIQSAGTLPSGHIVDFAPTLLALLGVAAPAHMRGRVWPELVPTETGSLT
jgi:predicted AlkP superfamily phosphohydrolase/phosphomutase